MGKVENKPKWHCKQCGECCKFVVIAIEGALDLETTGYLNAHGIAVANGKLLIPARCEYLTEGNLCSCHSNKFAACRLAGKKECETAKRDYRAMRAIRK